MTETCDSVIERQSYFDFNICRLCSLAKDKVLPIFDTSGSEFDAKIKECLSSIKTIDEVVTTRRTRILSQNTTLTSSGSTRRRPKIACSQIPISSTQFVGRPSFLLSYEPGTTPRAKEEKIIPRYQQGVEALPILSGALKGKIQNMEGEKRNPITVKAGSKTFMKELLKRNFQDASSILLEMKGNDITKDFFKEHGFKSPILVRETSGLGIKVPRVTDLNLLLKFLVPELDKVDVVDVEKQDTFSMQVIEYFKYMMNPVKTRILNLLSMEVSNTRLSGFIEAPKIVREIDWFHCYRNCTKEGHEAYAPSSIEKYFLISASKSFTNFHTDFSGTSVWYHIVSGVKEFFLIRPTSVNNQLYWKWNTSIHKESQFFGDQVDYCYKVTIHAGETLLLPSGWIHAVYTPVDSLIYGGNFLTTYNAEEQFAAYGMERKKRVPKKYTYPHFRELNWFAAEGLCKEVDALLATTDILSVPCHMINAIKVALPILTGWSTKMSVKDKSFFNCEQLIKDMRRILKLYGKAIAIRNTEKRESTRVMKRPNAVDFIRYEDFKVKRGKGQLEPRSTPAHQGNASEENSSSEAQRVKTDATKSLRVVLKRCSAVDSRPGAKTEEIIPHYQQGAAALPTLPRALIEETANAGRRYNSMVQENIINEQRIAILLRGIGPEERRQLTSDFRLWAANNNVALDCLLD